MRLFQHALNSSEYRFHPKPSKPSLAVFHPAESTEAIGHERNCYISLGPRVLTPWSTTKHTCCYSNHFANRNDTG